MKQNKIAMIYDFDGTLTPKTMQEYTLLPKLGLSPKSFWDSINEESKRTGGETMMVFMRHLLDKAKEKNIKISKNEFFKMGKDIRYYQGVSEWFNNINKYIKSLSGNDIQIYHYWKRLTAGKHLWFRNNCSTFLSQFIDTATVLLLLCTFGEISWNLFGGLLLAGFLFKIIIAALDTPFLYLGVYVFRKRFKLDINEEIELD